MIIRVKDLRKTYKTYKRGESFKDTVKSLFARQSINLDALKGISFEIEKGELLGFLGPNGAGKSTTLKILTGILYPTSGDVYAMGYVPWKDRKRYVTNIGAVFGQKSQLLWDIPPADAFYMNRSIYGIAQKTFKNTLNDMTDLLDVGDHIHRPTRQLSLGERMKCEFIMAMLHRPSIVFLDEPTIGLDILSREKIRQFILEMNKSGVTFILTTHDLSDIEHLAKRVIIVNHGDIVFDNSLDDLRRHTGNIKLIRLSSHDEIGDIQIRGVEVTENLSKYNVEMILDTTQTGLNEFVRQIGIQFRLSDLIIEEPPIEDMIKELYLDREAESKK